VARHRTLGDQTIEMEPHGIDVQPDPGGQFLDTQAVGLLPQRLQNP
jgi:hypothetical protein